MLKTLYLLMFCTFCVVSPTDTFEELDILDESSNIGITYAVAKIPTPVMYSQNFNEVFGGKDGKTLKLDGYGEIDELEFIAFPGTVFEILNEVYDQDELIYEVSTEEYPCASTKGCFIDARFVTTKKVKPEERKCEFTDKETIISNLKSMNGGIYTWGGNYSNGIPQLLDFYPPSSVVSSELRDQWMLKGNDCSGLLFEATNGCIPRNTSELVDFAKGVDIEGKGNEEIIEMLKPLDIIVWKGHMAVVIDNGNVIESNVDFDLKEEGFQGGVKIRSLEDFMDDMNEVHKRMPVNNYEDSLSNVDKPYVVRRWY